MKKKKSRILESIGHKVIVVEHIGNTAVPGLGGKPIIDIMAGVYHSTEADECLPLLRDLNYKNVIPQPEEPDWYYCLDKVYHGKTAKLKNYHLHLVKFMSNHWKKHLIFRDFLQPHPDLAQEYHELKKKLAAKYGSNRIGYTDAKTLFIKFVIDRALQRKARA